MKTKRPVKELRKKQITVGLVANGIADGWEVSVDETTEGPHRWFLEFDGPMCYLNFRIAGPIVVQASLDFLRGHLCPGQCLEKSVTRRPISNELQLSDFDGVVITALWDSESNDRCVFLIRGKKEFCARIEIELNQLRKFVLALEQVRDDLAQDGLLDGH